MNKKRAIKAQTITQEHKVNKMEIKKAQAVELWRQTKGHITNICSALGISRTTFYDWMQDPEFASLLLDAEAELNDDVRDALIQKIADGDMTAIIFYLKKRHPDYLERPNQVNTQINIDLPDWAKSNEA